MMTGRFPRPPSLAVYPLARATLVAALFGLSSAACATPRSAPRPQPLTDTERAVHLVSRATYGARPSDVDEVLRLGSSGWLDEQMQTPPEPEPPRPTTRVADLPDQMDRVARLLDLANGRYGLTVTKVLRAVQSDRQLEEVMTDFWFNHFNVSLTTSSLLPGTVADYEQNAIRAHVFGRFQEMLIATARHPAMIVYLDNYVSVAPSSDSSSVWRGLNENYARELLELHTLGVDGGYTQEDVIAVARAFTGWSVPVRLSGGSEGKPLVILPDIHYQTLLLDMERHDRGPKVVLGRDLPAGRGQEDGLDVLALLSRHPATARHLATKLAKHFVADDPPPAIVEELARVFLATDGDLREVTRALFTSPEFYDRAHYRAKVKRPFEFVASALRVTDADTRVADSIMASADPFRRSVPKFGRPWHDLLDQLQHVPYSQPSPTGYPTTAIEWMSSGALLDRMNFALDFASGSFAPITPRSVAAGRNPRCLGCFLPRG